MDPFEELVLRLGVERGGRLIQQEDACVAHEGARQRDFLPLATGEVDSGIEPLSERRFVALRKTRDQTIGSGLPAGFEDRLAVGDGAEVSQTDVLRRGRLVGHVILKHAADLGAQVGGINVPDVDAVDQDAAVGRIVEPADQLEERGLARAVAADDRDRLSG